MKYDFEHFIFIHLICSVIGGVKIEFNSPFDTNFMFSYKMVLLRRRRLRMQCDWIRNTIEFLHYKLASNKMLCYLIWLTDARVIQLIGIVWNGIGFVSTWLIDWTFKFYMLQWKCLHVKRWCALICGIDFDFNIFNSQNIHINLIKFIIISLVWLFVHCSSFLGFVSLS